MSGRTWTRVVPDLIPGVEAALAAGNTTALPRQAIEPLIVELVVTWWPPSMRAVHNPRHAAQRATAAVFDWLSEQPGTTWQERWDASPASHAAWDWLAQAGFEGPSRQTEARYAVSGLVVLEAVRPSLEWLLGTRHMRLWDDWALYHDRELYQLLDEALAATDDGRTQSRVFADLCRISISTGRLLPEITVDDFLAARDHVRASNRLSHTLNGAWHYAQRIGLFEGQPWELPVAQGPLTPQQLVDRYQVHAPALREVFIDYIAERAASCDYSRLEAVARLLVNNFWGDIQTHHPDIDSFALTKPQAEAWRERMKISLTGQPRRDWTDVMGVVRAFYLDLAEWAHDEPTRWGPWAAICPIPPRASREVYRSRHLSNARMKDRTRLLAPLLPQFVTAVTVEQRRTHALLAAGSQAKPGATFDFDGEPWRLVPKQANTWNKIKTTVVATDPQGQRVSITQLEDQAFWTWAAVEVLRHSGIRIEEMLELSHLSIRPYRKPDGTVIPLLQVAPSKTDRERILPVSPDLARALSAIVARHTTGTGSAIPLAMRRDEHQREYSAPMPFLFQRQWISGRNRVMSSTAIRGYLTDAANRIKLRDPSGRAIAFSPHDFRRLWLTDLIGNGFPIHIAAELAGHRDLNTTNGYNAIYPTDVFNHYEAIIRDRRAMRPSEEYRQPTDAELTEFAEHFGKRQVELGSCVRPYGTGCTHEHACIRCDFLTVSPDAAPRLNQIGDDLQRRLGAAEDNKWLGDVEQLRLTIDHLNTKRDHLADLVSVTPAASLAYPSF